ncbi:MAG: tetratricopeptide repeat protein [Planctomycetota bacterium]|nr:tetratricopeptide repeat protein [Planctomycetota bacterium]
MTPGIKKALIIGSASIVGSIVIVTGTLLKSDSGSTTKNDNNLTAHQDTAHTQGNRKTTGDKNVSADHGGVAISGSDNAIISGNGALVSGDQNITHMGNGTQNIYTSDEERLRDQSRLRDARGTRLATLTRLITSVREIGKFNKNTGDTLQPVIAAALQQLLVVADAAWAVDDEQVRKRLRETIEVAHAAVAGIDSSVREWSSLVRSFDDAAARLQSNLTNSSGLSAFYKSEYDREVARIQQRKQEVQLELNDNLENCETHKNRMLSQLDLVLKETGQIAQRAPANSLENEQVQSQAFEYFERGYNQMQVGQWQKAIDQCDHAIELLNQLPSADDAELRALLAQSFTNRGTALLEVGQSSEALRDLDHAVRLFRQMPQDNGALLGTALLTRAKAWSLMKNFDAGLSDVDEGIELITIYVARNPKDAMMKDYVTKAKHLRQLILESKNTP